MKISNIKITCIFKLNIKVLFIFSSISQLSYSQVSSGSSAYFGLRKLNFAYNGSAIEVRRTCDNAVNNIGFTSCGHLDTVALKKFVVASNPLSALTSSAIAAYSLRRLRCTYVGSAIRVRRSSDNTLTDIGFTVNGDLDTVALKTFVGASNGFINTWYDQSGTAKHVVQATIANQPRVISAGVVLRQNGMPVVRFISASSTALLLNTSMVTDRISISCIAQINNASARSPIFDLSAGGGGFQHFIIEANTWNTIGNRWGYYANNNSYDGVAATSNSLTSLSLVAVNAFTSTANVIINSTMYVNGASSGLSCRACNTGNYRNVWPNGFVIGGINGFASTFDGNISELIIFPINLSNTERSFLEWSQSQYYNISGINLGTLPPGAASGFISRWYDQSGNGNDAVQAAFINQPRIINNGIIQKQNAQPAIFLDGANYFLSQSSLSIGNPYSLNVITSRLANGGSSGYQRLINVSSTGDAFGYLGALNGNYASFAGNGAGTWNDITANTPASSLILNTPFILSTLYSTGAIGLLPFFNGTGNTPKVGTAATGTGFFIGSPYNANALDQLWNGTISEFHVFPSAFITRRVLLESSQSAYNNIAITDGRYIPPTANSYNLHVNGIGYTSATDSVYGTRNTVGMGFVNSASAPYLKDNGDYMMSGINCPISGLTSVLNLPPTVVQRWENDWYVNKTDASSNNGNLSFYFDFSDYGLSLSPGVAANYVLLYRTSPVANFTIVPGTTPSVAGDRVFFSVDASNVITDFYYTIGTRNISFSPLPIELLSFDAACDNNSVNITWSTSSEINNSYFILERSSDGINYQAITKIDGAGNSIQKVNYSYNDKSRLFEYVYYRLTQIDVNGSEKQFDPVSINCDKNKKEILVYPNPSLDYFIIEGGESNSTATIYNQLGEKVLIQEILSNKTEVKVNNFSNGVYFLKIEGSNNTFIKKIIIQR